LIDYRFAQIKDIPNVIHKSETIHKNVEAGPLLFSAMPINVSLPSSTAAQQKVREGCKWKIKGVFFHSSLFYFWKIMEIHFIQIKYVSSIE
jgi:hypothetical protein